MAQKSNRSVNSVPSQEDIYRLLAREDWSGLLSFAWNNPDLIASEPIFKHAYETGEAVFFTKLASEPDKEKLVNTLESFRVCHFNGKYVLSDERIKTIAIELVKLWRNKDLEEAYSRAKSYPDDELCHEVIKQYEDLLPKQIAHSQSDKVTVTENRNIAEIDARCNLFKSKQEKEFFAAVKDVFQMFTIYPNVALSSIFTFDLIKERLSPAEKDYFFKAVVDCVVFDHGPELYQPLHFFEIDSRFHDAPEQQQKDKYKDNIFAAAGQRLIRVRRKKGEQNRDDFVRLIRELMGSA